MPQERSSVDNLPLVAAARADVHRDSLLPARKRRPPYWLHRPGVKAMLIAMLGEGREVNDICALLDIVPRSLYSFQERFATEIAAHAARVDAAVADLAIASKTRRIAAKDARHKLLEVVRRERAAGRTGVETGLVTRKLRKVGRGDDAEWVEEYEIDKGILAALDGLERDAAEELGQLPRGANINVFAGTRGVFDQQQQAVLDAINAAAAASDDGVIDVSPPTAALDVADAAQNEAAS